MAKMSELGRPEQEFTGVRIQFSPRVPVEPIQMMVESCATGSCGCGCATDIEEISVEDTDAGPQIHVHGDNLSVASVAGVMAECDIPDALATSTSAAVMPDRATSARQAAIQEQYGRIAETAEKGGEGCGCGETAGGQDLASAQLGYAPDDLTSVPAGANLGLGCGNPLAIASLRPGETVLIWEVAGGWTVFSQPGRLENGVTSLGLT